MEENGGTGSVRIESLFHKTEHPRGFSRYGVVSKGVWGSGEQVNDFIQTL